MSKLRIIMLAAFCLLAVILWADAGGLAGTGGVSVCHIEGLNSFPGTSFSLVTWFWDQSREGYGFSFTKVLTDTLSLQLQRSIYHFDYLAWNPILQKLNENHDYRYLKTGLEDPNSEDKANSKILGLPHFKDGLFSKIDTYCRVTKAADRLSDGSPKYTLSIYKRIYQLTGMEIIAEGDFDKIPQYISARPSAERYYSAPSPTRKDSLIAYAKTLPAHHVVAIADTLDPSIKINPDHPIFRLVVKLMEFFKPDVDSNLFLIALILSIAIEFLVLLLLFKPLTQIRVSGLKQILFIFITCGLATAFTISLNWWIFPMFLRIYMINLLVTELFAIGVEAFVYAKVFHLPFKTALFLSAACNFCSYGGGVLLFSLVV